jgi:hypothetical protein
MALRNRHVAGESDIEPQKQICGCRVRYMASESDKWLESQIYGPETALIWRVSYMASKTDMWLES